MKRKPSAVEIINNLLLLDSNLRHIGFELSRPRPSFFRAARESHLALLRSMVEALRGTANFAISGPRKRARLTQYQIGNNRWKEIHRVEVTGCKKAWRFSLPSPCSPPELTPPKPSQSIADEQRLLGFYDLFAMIQTECFMIHVYRARPVEVSDHELREIEWLHENVRNEFEHYIPKSYYVGIPALVSAAHLALRITDLLLYDSGTVLSHYVPRGTRTRLSRVIRHLARLKVGPL
jgi:hypothetical protein